MARFTIAMTETGAKNVDLEAAFFRANDVNFIKIAGSSAAEIIAGAADCDALIVVLAEITPEIIAQLKQCKVIVRRGIGYDNVNIEAATKRNIMVANVPDYCHAEVAEHTMALFLALCRKIPMGCAATRLGKWDKGMLRPIPRIEGKVFGILGCGAIGRSVAKRAAAFGLTIHGHDPFMPEDVLRRDGVIPCPDLGTFLASVDFLSLHSPLTPETKGIINKDTLALMRPHCLLINTARGGLIDEAALHTALREGKLGGAGLDVLIEEPPKGVHPLAALDNVLLTPHVAFYSVESDEDLAAKAAAEALRALTEGKPRFWVNKAGF